MNKEQIMGQIKTLVEMLYLTGEKSGMETAEKIFNPKEFGNPVFSISFIILAW